MRLRSRGLKLLLPFFLLLGIRRVATRFVVSEWFIKIASSLIENSAILMKIFEAAPSPFADIFTAYQGKRMCWCEKSCVVNEYGVCVRGRYLLLLCERIWCVCVRGRYLLWALCTSSFKSLSGFAYVGMRRAGPGSWPYLAPHVR